MLPRHRQMAMLPRLDKETHGQPCRDRRQRKSALGDALACRPGCRMTASSPCAAWFAGWTTKA